MTMRIWRSDTISGPRYFATMRDANRHRVHAHGEGISPVDPVEECQRLNQELDTAEIMLAKVIAVLRNLYDAAGQDVQASEAGIVAERVIRENSPSVTSRAEVRERAH